MMQVNLRIYRTILALTLGLFLSLSAFAQQITVNGHVKDSTGEPVIGANVLEKGTTNGTITDIDGNFKMQAAKGATLVISYVGYLPVEVKADTMTMTEFTSQNICLFTTLLHISCIVFLRCFTGLVCCF